MATLETSPDGLSPSQAATRMQRDGPNSSTRTSGPALSRRLIRKCLEPLTAMLFIAAATLAATGDAHSSLVIAFVLAFSIGLDITQEASAERAVAALKSSVAVTAVVRRDGRRCTFPASELVAGDIVELHGGDLVPADGLVIVSDGAVLNESTLTGESAAVEKSPAHDGALSTDDTSHAVFSGTSVVSGHMTMLVVNTGASTRFAGIAAALGEVEPPSAFERGVHGLGMLILRLTGFLVLVVLLSQLIKTHLTLETFVFAIAIAVGLTPELLPMVMTVSMSRGALRMAKRKVIVKRLSSIHDLGAMDILCTDKTGTLTEARITLTGVTGPDGSDFPRALELALVNTSFSRGVGNALDDAILSDARSISPTWQPIVVVPFDFDRRRSSVLARHAGETPVLICKGAPEGILPLCHLVDRPDGTVLPLDDRARAAIEETIRAEGTKGRRLLAVAWKREDRVTVSAADENDLIYAGCLGFSDPPKQSATGAVARLSNQGVRVKVISGDADGVVQHLVEVLNLPLRGIVTGSELARLSNASLARLVERVDAFARITPDQKMRIVEALRKNGHTVGFVGDGINDAPAIHAADVGLSVDSGTAVARDAADIVLLDQDLSVIADGVEEGRRIYSNIMKYVRMGTSSNFGNMLSTAVASIFLPFLPLLPLQILLNNLIYDLSEIGIPFDTADEEDLRRPHVWNMASILRFTLVMGPLSSVFDLATFSVLRLWFAAPVELFRTGWFLESLFTQLLVIFVIRTARPFWSSRVHGVLLASTLGALLVGTVMAMTSIGRAFAFTPLPLSMFLTMVAMSLCYLAAAEIAKPYAFEERPGLLKSLGRQLAAPAVIPGKRHGRVGRRAR